MYEQPTLVFCGNALEIVLGDKPGGNGESFSTIGSYELDE